MGTPRPAPRTMSGRACAFCKISRPGAILQMVLGFVLLGTVASFSKPNTRWRYCGDVQGFVLQVKSVVLDPETVERGKQFTFAVTGNFGHKGGTTNGVTAHVTILYDLGKKVSDAQAGQMRLKGLDVEQLEKRTTLRILNHERPLGTLTHGHLTQQSDKSTLPEHLPAG